MILTETNSSVFSRRTDTGIKFFNAYCDIMDLIHVRRMGFTKCGSNGRFWPDTAPTFDCREQSDAEHTLGTIVLVELFSTFYPDQVDKNCLFEYCQTMITHELGEVKSGDIPDDGTRDNAAKDASELVIVKHFYNSYYPKELAKTGIDRFVEFVDKDTDFGKICYAFDKLDAILFNLYLEKIGRPGSMKWKRRHFAPAAPQSIQPSGRMTDAACISITGSDFPADNWFCGFICTEGVPNYPIFQTILEVVQSAAFAVRKEEMQWLNNMPFDIY